MDAEHPGGYAPHQCERVADGAFRRDRAGAWADMSRYPEKPVALSCSAIGLVRRLSQIVIVPPTRSRVYSFRLMGDTQLIQLFLALKYRPFPESLRLFALIRGFFLGS
jgi:hypothetical protein